jgi:hypothetical protein
LEFLNLFNADAREPSMEDAKGIRACIQEMKTRDLEFKLKVDKAQTVPYTVQIDQLQADGVLLAFQRPLPPELAKGALFLGNFQMEGQNFQFPTKFQGRTAYLRYLFTWPERILKLERRNAPRLPFRPREKAEAGLRDGGVPGVGVSGPILNLSRQGVAIRVDRVLRLDNGFRLSVNNSHFPPGKFFDLVRLQGLPGLSKVDFRGFVVHATDKGGILMLGLTFQETEGEAIRMVEECLKLRLKLQQAKAPSGAEPATPGSKKAGGSPSVPKEAPISWDSPEVWNENPPESTEEAASLDQDPLRILLRRTLPLVIEAPSPEAAEPLTRWLRERGYLRLTQSATDSHDADTVVLNTRPGVAPGRNTLVVPPPEMWERDLVPQLEKLAFERT